MTFTPPFFLSGEVGYPLAAQRIELDALGVASATLSLKSLATDTLTFTQFIPAGYDGIAPTNKQRLTLWDSTGKRLFCGIARVTGSWSTAGMLYTVTVSGPYDFLTKTELRGPVEDSDGNIAIRPSVVYPIQSLQISIRQLLENMRAAGMEMVPGRIDPMFPPTRMTFNKKTGEDALTDMLKFVRDASSRVNYDVDGLPQIDFIRRANAQVITLQLGTNDDDTLGITLQENEDLRPTSVTVLSVDRNDQGQPIFVEETAGPGGDEAYREQTLVASGYENGQTPAEVFENTEVETADADWAFVKVKDTAVISAIQETADATLIPSTGATINLYSSAGGGSLISYTPKAPQLKRADGSAFGYAVYALVTDSLPDWVISDYNLTVEDAVLYGQFYQMVTGTGTPGNDLVEYLRDQGLISTVQGYNANIPGATYVRYFFYTATIQCKVIQVEYNPAQTLFRKQDFNFLYPPSGLADNLYKAQNFAPWEGSGSLGPRAKVIPGPGDLVNVTGALDAWRTAQAGVKSMSIELRTGQASFEIGTPARLDAPTLLDSFRRAADDNTESA